MHVERLLPVLVLEPGGLFLAEYSITQRRGVNPAEVA